MQKRTRIFAAITVAVGLLLGLAMFASMFLGEAASVGAAPARKHHNTRTHVTTTVIRGSTTTVTVTSTSVTTTTPVTPQPFCFAFPNPVNIGTGVGGGNPAGNVQFVEQCHNLSPNDQYSVTWNFSTCTNGVLTVDGLTIGIGPTGGPFGAFFPDKFGDLSFNFQFSNCRPGTGNVTVTDIRTGQAFVTLVTLQ